MAHHFLPYTQGTFVLHKTLHQLSGQGSDGQCRCLPTALLSPVFAGAHTPNHQALCGTTRHLQGPGHPLRAGNRERCGLSKRVPVRLSPPHFWPFAGPAKVAFNSTFWVPPRFLTGLSLCDSGPQVLLLGLQAGASLARR